MGQKLNGPLGSWVTMSDPFPALGWALAHILVIVVVVLVGDVDD